MEIVMYTDNDRHRYRIIKKLPEIRAEYHEKKHKNIIYIIDYIEKIDYFQITDEEHDLQKDYEFYIIYYHYEIGKERYREANYTGKEFCAIEKNIYQNILDDPSDFLDLVKTVLEEMIEEHERIDKGIIWK